MKPILYDAAETAFTSNGLGELSDCISCTVEEERNGKYELEMRYPITGKRFSDILHSRLILATPADGKNPQAFRIYQITKPINGIVTVYAEHISYQLSHIPVNPFLEVTSVQTALMTIAENVAETCPFTFETTKSSTGKMSLDEPRSVRALLGGTEGSILDCFGGGEYEWDMYTVRLYQNRGMNNGVTLRYGKNITDLEQEESISNTITGVYPYWRGNVDDAEVIVTLPEKVVHSSNYTNYPYPRTITLDCSQQFKEQPTVAQLRTYANSYISKTGVGIPKVSLTVKFLPLWQSEEYKDIANLERVNLCDTVTVQFPALEVSATAKVVRTKFDVLKERYDEIELGDTRTSFTSQVRGDIENAITTTTQKITGVQAAIEKDIQRNSDMITGNRGGNIVHVFDSDNKPIEFLIMDTEDIQTAVNVWRFNAGGLGHSHDGYDGPFDDIALTADGHINASMISVGTLNAARIKAGLLSDVAGSNYWNMETGEFRLASTATVGGKTVQKIAEDAGDAAVEAQTQQTIFNKLTNNGQTQGIYLSNGKVYINASMINTGTMSASYIKGGHLRLGGGDYQDGIIQMYDENGEWIGSWTKNGLSVAKGAISGSTITCGGSGGNDGKIRIYDADGTMIGSWTASGLSVLKGTISGTTIKASTFEVKGDGKISLCNTSGTEVGVISKDGFYYGVKPNTGFDHITTFEGTKINASAGIILTGNRKVEIYEDELETNSMKILADAKGMDFWVNTSFAYGDKDYARRGMIKLVLDDEYDHTTHLRVQASGQLLLESSDVCFKATNVSVMSGSTEYHGYSGTISTGSKSLKFLKGLLVSAT